MILKRILLIFAVVISVFTLAACKDTEPNIESYTLILTSNIEEATPTFVESDVVEGAQTFILSTDEMEGYLFQYWSILGRTGQLSTELLFVYTPTADVTIQAIYIQDEVIDDAPVIVDYVVTVTSNVESITVDVLDTLTNSGETQYELTASIHEDFTFLYWIDVDTEEVLSSDLLYAFVASKDQSIEAIYELTPLPIPTLTYETTFDDASKDSYAEAIVALSGESWTFSDALLGNLATDLKVEGKSVRIRDGYIQSEFSVTDLAQVIFHAGTYGSDDVTTINFQISLDKTTWVTVESFTSSETLDEYSYIFDDELFSSLSLDSESAYYFRIESEAASRVNIDNLKIYTGEGFIGDDTPLYTISFTETMVNQYLLNDTVDLTGCIATHSVVGNTTCDIDGEVDSSVAGVYEIIFSKTDEYGNTAVEIIRITVIDPVNVDINMDLISYYDDAEGLYGDALLDALNIILNTGFTGVTYGEARYILDDSDADPSNSNNLILVYLGTSISGVWDSGSTWNREHVWPQSLLGVGANNSVVNVASDLYNLMPANPGENSTRGNSPYSALGLGYEPRDEVKGDVARALFYMMVMYDNLNLVNTAPGIHEMGYLDELLAWHYSDPVSQFEINRLEVIAAEQSNRNPFVDYPHLVDLLWFYDNSAE